MVTYLMPRSPAVPRVALPPQLPDSLPTTPATRWHGQPVRTATDRLHALRQRLPTFQREPFIVNGIENPHYDVIVAADTAYPVTTVSKAYGLVQHASVVDRALAGLDSLGFDVQGLEAELALTAHGERLKLSITIPGYDFDPGDGCPLVLRMTVLNSVDKTTAVAIELEWLRLVCGNGMMAGIGTAGFRKAHFRGIDEEDIAEYLQAALHQVPQDRRLMADWLEQPVPAARALPWVDTALAECWGAPTAARIWHILRHGWDARPIITRGQEGEVQPPRPPHARPVTPLGPVPGACAPVANAYHVAQALSWVAKEHPHMATRLRRIKEIAPLMRQLLTR